MDEESWIGVLVAKAMRTYGRNPHDVYKSILHPQQMEQDVVAAVDDLSFEELQEIVERLASQAPTLSRATHRCVFSVTSQRSDDEVILGVRWKVTFKSPVIARMVVQKLVSKQPQHLLESYHLFRRLPQSSLLADWFFRPIAQGLLSDTRQAPFSLIPMQPNTETAFVTADNVRSSEHRLPRREFSVRSFAPGSFHGGVEENKYLFSDVSDTPHFDAILVERENDGGIVLWVLQTTSAVSTHKGEPSEESPLINEILQAIGSTGRLILRYVLVEPRCGDDPGQSQWKMPAGWTRNQGEVFCAFLDVPVTFSFIWCSFDVLTCPVGFPRTHLKVMILLLKRREGAEH